MNLFEKLDSISQATLMKFQLDRILLSYLWLGIALCCSPALLAHAEESSSTRVACLGDSITAGARVDAETQSYPARLQTLLGKEYEVRNFGIGGATLIKTGRPNIWMNLEAVQKFEPHIVVISLGTNDTVGGKRKNWEQIDRFEEDYSELIQTLAAMPTKPQIVICTPTAMVLSTPELAPNRLADLKERKVRLQELCERTRKLAEKHAAQNVSLLELNSVLQDRPELLSKSDGVHPNEQGYLTVAQAVYQHLKPAKTPLNVVLFLVDDMGWMDSTPYGSEYYETPNMQRLATQSMRFTDAYALPLCSPTRASILTGQYSSRHGVTSASGHRPAAAPGASPYPAKAPLNSQFIYPNSKNYLEPDLMTLAEVMHEAGYQTGHFGKWHLGLSQEHWPDKHGFDIAFHAQPSPGPPSYFSPYGVKAEGQPGGRTHVGTITDGPDGEYITDRLTDEAIKFVEANQNKPFFLNFWHYGVHGPWGHKEEYTAQFSDKVDPRGQQRNPIMASMLKSVDESLGRLLTRLEELELTDNTLFIFYSDNGGNVHSRTFDDQKIARVKPGHPQYEAIQDWRKWAGGEPPTNNAPLREGKGRIYEGGQRVPLIVRWPGKIESGSISEEIVGPIDLYPTILEAVGLKKPEGHIVDGQSILPVLTQSGSLNREAYFTWFPHLVPAVSVRQGPWKLIHRFEPHSNYPAVRELYNLKDDIGETQNLAKERPEKVKELDGLIEKFIQDTEALAPIPNPAFRGRADASAGLVPKSCEIDMIEGAIRVTGAGRAPFLGSAQIKLTGPLKLTLIARSKMGGKGHVLWKLPSEENFQDLEQGVLFELPASDEWQEIVVDLPIKGVPQIVRLYLPAQSEPVEVKSIRYQDADGKEKSWDFSEVQP